MDQKIRSLTLHSCFVFSFVVKDSCFAGTRPLLVSVIKVKKYRVATIKKADNCRQFIHPWVYTLCVNTRSQCFDHVSGRVWCLALSWWQITLLLSTTGCLWSKQLKFFSNGTRGCWLWWFFRFLRILTRFLRIIYCISSVPPNTQHYFFFLWMSVLAASEQKSEEDEWCLLS